MNFTENTILNWLFLIFHYYLHMLNYSFILVIFIDFFLLMHFFHNPHNYRLLETDLAQMVLHNNSCTFTNVLLIHVLSAYSYLNVHELLVCY